MKRGSRHPVWNWIIHTPWVLTVLGLLAVAIFFGSGAGNPLLQRLIVRKLETLTGARVEIRSLSIRWLSLHATLKGLVIHGREPVGTEPLFSAEEVDAGIRIDSVWSRKVSLNDLLVQRPLVHIRVEKDGSTNVPAPVRPTSSKKSLREKLFDLRVRVVKLQDGWVLYNDVKTPLALEGSDLHLTLDAGSSVDRPLYLGNLNWSRVSFTAGPYLPLPTSVSAKFTLSRDGFTLEQGVFSAGRSHIDAQAELVNFSQPQWKFRYRGWLDLLDFREILRSPNVPSGKVDIQGEGRYAGGQLQDTGGYAARNIALSYELLHAAGLTSRAAYRIDNRGLDVRDFSANAFGGSVKGHIAMRFDTQQFRAETHVQGMRLAEVFPAIDHPGFPVDELHWDGVLTADTVETWTGPLRNFEISGSTAWLPPENLAAGHQPVTANWQFRYRYEPNILSIASGDFETPSSRGSFSGVLASRNSSLDVKFETGALETFGDLVHAIEGTIPSKALSGSANWEGKITGSLKGPTFAGHARGERVRYDGINLDSLEGDLKYSPSELSFIRGRARRGEMDVQIEAHLDLARWRFLPDNDWSGEIDFEKTPVDNIQQLMGRSYPVHGLLSGQFHGRGTRAEPMVTGLFDLADGTIYDLSFSRLRGQLNLTPGEIRIADAELRFFTPGTENGRGAGIVTGTAGYRPAEETISAELTGASLPLENIQKLQSSRLSIGGQVSFRLKINGPVQAPLGEGTFRIVDFRVGQEIIGSFDAGLTSDGRTAHLQLGSAMTTGDISGNCDLGLSSPFPLQGKISIRNIDLDPFFVAALHLKGFSGHGKADGNISLNGALKQPKDFIIQADFSRLTLNYANVQLENVGPVRLRSSSQALEIEPATLKGTDTNFQVGGSISFSNRRAINLRLNGALDLKLLSGFVSDLEARGPAQINAIFEGTLDQPRITGRAHIENASVRAVDFPTGLSALKGDFVFDTTRLFFEDVTAEAGGGTLHASGTISYTERPIRYDITWRTDHIRIRYPEGMSWLAGGSLRLTGTPEAAVLSGRVTVERVTLTQGLEVASALVSAKEGISGPSTSSPFLRNLQFDIEALSTPDARMEWPNAELQAEANLRVRGTWEHPILLGHIHILSGDLYFAGNRYRVSRGDLNFANPFRLDPVLNVEATTNVQQYEITLNFNGPASKLTLAYRSDPPLPANDIVTLLAIGQTSSEAYVRSGGASQSGASSASAILSEAISSQLGGRVERLFGLTRFRVDPGLAGVGSTGSEQNPGARVTVEQQVTRNLTITYISNVSSTQEQVIQVEYNVDRNISIVALRDQNGTFGIDVKIKKRFP